MIAWRCRSPFGRPGPRLLEGLRALRALVAALASGVAACAGGAPAESLPTADSPAEWSAYGDAQPVILDGYTSDAMEPALSADGAVLVFNDSNAPENDTDLHWATRVDDLHFAYQGRVTSANSTALDGVASLDDAGDLYFISTRAYTTDNRVTVYRAHFEAGAVTALEVVSGLESQGPGWLILDAFISRDGKELYCSEGDFSTGTLGAAYLSVARKDGAGFSRAADGGAAFAALNLADAAQYAPALSADGLELYFTRIVGPATTGTFLSTRPDRGAAWGEPTEIEALSGGVAEAAAPTADGTALYYHRAVGGTFRLERVTRE